MKKIPVEIGEDSTAFEDFQYRRKYTPEASNNERWRQKVKRKLLTERILYGAQTMKKFTSVYHFEVEIILFLVINICL